MTHEEVAVYNWDDGISCIWPVVDSRDTELATAILIFWRLEGPWILDAATSSVTDEVRRMAEVVKDRIVTGYYLRGAVHYDPIADHQLNHLQVLKLKKAGLSEVFLSPV